MWRGGGPRTWWAPWWLCSASLRGATSPRAGAEVRRWARAPAKPPGAECAGGAALARNPHFHGDLGIGVPFFFFFLAAPFFSFSLYLFSFTFSRIVRIVLLMHAPPPPGGHQQRCNSSACTAGRVPRAATAAQGWWGRLPHPPPPGWPAPFPSLPCAGTDVRLAALGRAGGERIAIIKNKGKNEKKKKKSCFARGTGREIPSLGTSPPPGFFSPQVMRQAASAGRGPPAGSQPLRLGSSPRSPPSAAENQPFISENYSKKYRLQEPLPHILIIRIISREFRKQQ